MPAKKLSGRQLVEEILRISDQLEGQFRREFLSAIAGISSSKELRKLIADIGNGNISFGDPIDVRLSRVVIPTKKMDEIARKALGASARASASIVPRAQPRFDVTNPTVISLARRMSIDLSTNLNATTKENIRKIVIDALEGNITQAEAARKIRTHVGLLPAHAEAVDRYYQNMIDSGTKKSVAQKRADQYAKRLLDSRARTIARTEIANAVGKGQSEMWKQMRRDGLLPPNAVKVWVTAADERVCPICGPMNGVEAEVDGFWNVGGLPKEYPQSSHPNCRCTSVISEPPRTRIGKNDDLDRDHWLIKHQTGKHSQKAHAGKRAVTRTASTRSGDAKKTPAKKAPEKKTASRKLPKKLGKSEYDSMVEEQKVKARSLTPEERNGFDAYFGDMYPVIRKILVKGPLTSEDGGFEGSRYPEIMNERTSYFVSGVPKVQTPTPRDAVVYRGIVVDRAKVYKVGDVIRDPSYVSTSIDQAKGSTFAGVINPKMGTIPADRKRVVLTIVVPKGTPVVADGAGKSVYKDEGEILLPKGGAMKVVSTEVKTGRWGLEYDSVVVEFEQ